MITKVRPARPEEADDLTALCMRSKRSQGYDDAFMALCAGELKVTPARIEKGRFWVAERDAVCGCACLCISDDGRVGEVEAFFVDPDCQKQGVGKLLWKQILSSAVESGLTRLHLDADPFAEGFYRKLGFKTVGRVPSGSIPGRTLPYMEMRLGDRGEGSGASQSPTSS